MIKDIRVALLPEARNGLDGAIESRRLRPRQVRMVAPLSPEQEAVQKKIYQGAKRKMSYHLSEIP